MSGMLKPPASVMGHSRHARCKANLALWVQAGQLYQSKRPHSEIRKGKAVIEQACSRDSTILTCPSQQVEREGGRGEWGGGTTGGRTDT